MPIPSNQVKTVEIHIHGDCAAAGSNDRKSDQAFFFNRTNTALALSTKAQIDTAFQTAIVVPLGAMLNARWLQSRNSVRFPDDAQDAFVDFSHAVVGAIAGDSMPSFASLYQELKTGLRGKNFRGAKHYFPMSESDTTSGSDDLWNAGCLARAATLATAILAGFTDAGGNVWQPVVLSKKLSQQQTNPTTIITNLVNAIRTNKRVGRMRHREVVSVY